MDILDRLLGHDEYTTRELLEICTELPDRMLDQKFDLGHGTLRETLDHIVDNIETWTDLMKGWSKRPERQQGQTILELINRFNVAYKEFAKFAKDIQVMEQLDQQWVDVLDDPPESKTYGGAIVHLITHSMHHRAQVIHMLKRLGIKDVPEGDVLGWEKKLGVPKRKQE